VVVIRLEPSCLICPISFLFLLFCFLTC
jgi:hypothetical protein